ncbi:hypothetical protein ACIQV3_36430 [Streptomyces sp. NPDC099050]|uniref:hypothetical protein n=1 Tax=Streptomyces sp. NPDC099050 TaxID=3366100 RepID=UPI003816444F
MAATDVEVLVAQEHLVAVDSYKGWLLYSTAAARDLDVDVAPNPGAAGGVGLGSVHWYSTPVSILVRTPVAGS